VSEIAARVVAVPCGLDSACLLLCDRAKPMKDPDLIAAGLTVILALVIALALRAAGIVVQAPILVQAPIR